MPAIEVAVQTGSSHRLWTTEGNVCEFAQLHAITNSGLGGLQNLISPWDEEREFHLISTNDFFPPNRKQARQSNFKIDFFWNTVVDF